MKLFEVHIWKFTPLVTPVHMCASFIVLRFWSLPLQSCHDWFGECITQYIQFLYFSWRSFSVQLPLNSNCIPFFSQSKNLYHSELDIKNAIFRGLWLKRKQSRTTIFFPPKNKKTCVFFVFLHNVSRPTLTYLTMSRSSFSRSLHLSLDFFHASSRCFCLKTTHMRILPSLNSTLWIHWFLNSFCYLYFHPLLPHRHHAVPLVSVCDAQTTNALLVCATVRLPQLIVPWTDSLLR